MVGGGCSCTAAVSAKIQLLHLLLKKEYVIGYSSCKRSQALVTQSVSVLHGSSTLAIVFSIQVIERAATVLFCLLLKLMLILKGYIYMRKITYYIQQIG